MPNKSGSVLSTSHAQKRFCVNGAPIYDFLHERILPHSHIYKVWFDTISLEISLQRRCWTFSGPGFYALFPCMFCQAKTPQQWEKSEGKIAKSPPCLGGAENNWKIYGGKSSKTKNKCFLFFIFNVLLKKV